MLTYISYMKEFKSYINKAVIVILTPLVRTLIRHGISHSEFSDLAKRVYIDVVHKDFSIPKRKTTYARVSTLTGLTRKEIVRITEPEKQPDKKAKKTLNRATQVLGGWMKNKDFLNEHGEPSVLPIKSDNKKSFYDLVDKFSGDVSGGAILQELIRVGAVEKTVDGNVKMTQQGYVPQNSQAEQLRIVSTHFADMLTTGIYNIENGEDKVRFQRAVVYENVPNYLVNEFKQFSNTRSLQLLVQYSDWLQLKLNENESEEFSKDSCGRVGVGVYYFNNSKSED